MPPLAQRSFVAITAIFWNKDGALKPLVSSSNRSAPRSPVTSTNLLANFGLLRAKILQNFSQPNRCRSNVTGFTPHFLLRERMQVDWSTRPFGNKPGWSLVQ